jgi:hypothetical protein
MFMCGAELEVELLGIWEAMDTAAGYIHACDADQEERFLDFPNHVQDSVELDIHRGAAVALTVAQVHSGHMLHHLVGLPEGQDQANHNWS